jgi:hypothetical protein
MGSQLVGELCTEPLIVHSPCRANRQCVVPLTLQKTAHPRGKKIKTLIDHIVGMDPIVHGHCTFRPLGQSIHNGMRQGNS